MPSFVPQFKPNFVPCFRVPDPPAPHLKHRTTAQENKKGVYFHCEGKKPNVLVPDRLKKERTAASDNLGLESEYTHQILQAYLQENDGYSAIPVSKRYFVPQFMPVIVPRFVPMVWYVFYRLRWTEPAFSGRSGKPWRLLTILKAWVLRCVNRQQPNCTRHIDWDCSSFTRW